MTSTSPLTSVSGLISGLDTSSIITQLMQIKAEAQTALNTTLTNTQSAITSYQDLNTKFQSLLTAAQNLANPRHVGRAHRELERQLGRGVGHRQRAHRLGDLHRQPAGLGAVADQQRARHRR